MTLIKLKEGEKALFEQKRTGEDGELFTIYKFRTTQGNHKVPSFQGEISDDLIYKGIAQGNPTVTKMGRWQQKYCIGESPNMERIGRNNEHSKI